MAERKAKTPAKVGRPRTTLDKLPADWQDRMLSCAQEGGSAIETRIALGIGRSAWDTLIANEPEFQTAVKDAEDLCRVWWEKSGRMLAVGGGGNSAIWIFNMKNRFGWRDRAEESSDETPVAPVRVEISVKDARKPNDDDQPDA